MKGILWTLPVLFFQCLSSSMLVGYGGVYAASESKEKVYQHMLADAPKSMDPVAGGDLYSSAMITSVYDTVLEYRYLSDPWQLKPSLGNGMPSVSRDGLTIRIEFKKGVRFHDDPAFPKGLGRELVAGDFEYSLKRHFDPRTRSANKWLWAGRIVGLDEWGENGADYAKPVPGIKVLGSHSVKIRLTAPFPQFLYTLAMAPSAVVPVEAVEKYGPEISIHPVGSGPWMLVSYSKKKAEMVRNPAYREELFDLAEHGYREELHGYTQIRQLAGRKLPILDRIRVHFMNQDAALLHPLCGEEGREGKIQYGILPASKIAQVLASKSPVALKGEYAAKFQVRATRELGHIYYEFNMDDPNFGYSVDPIRNAKNKALRCAIRKAFDWESRIRDVYHGLGEAFPGMIPPGVEGYDPDLSRESVTLDVAGAKKLLNDYGWRSSDFPVLNYPEVASMKHRQFYEQFRSWLARIGYPRHKIRIADFPNFGDFIRAKMERKLSIHPLGWALDYPDAENVLQLYYGPNRSPGSNSANYNNATYDALYRRSSVMEPGPERNALYRQANQILIDDCVTISGFARTRIHLWDKNLAMYPSSSPIGNYFKYVGYITNP